MSQLAVLIIGCGNIAGGFDVGKRLDSYPVTHAGAYERDERFQIVACIDPDRDARELFMETWSVPKGYASIEEASEDLTQIDVISICSPTRFHSSDVTNSIGLKPQLIFSEKPVTYSYSETMRLVGLCREHNILFAVNHNRRWDPKVIELKSAIDTQEHGHLRSVVGFYNKGALNNGSHLIDLLSFLLGDIEVVATLPGVNDFNEADLTIPALMKTTGGVPVHLVTAHAQDFSLFEVQFIFSEKVLTMCDGGMRWQIRAAKESGRFSGYRDLDQGVSINGGYKYATINAVNNIYEALIKGEKIRSDGDSAAQAQKVCEQIIVGNN